MSAIRTSAVIKIKAAKINRSASQAVRRINKIRTKVGSKARETVIKVVNLGSRTAVKDRRTSKIAIAADSKVNRTAIKAGSRASRTVIKTVKATSVKQSQ